MNKPKATSSSSGGSIIPVLIIMSPYILIILGGIFLHDGGKNLKRSDEFSQKEGKSQRKNGIIMLIVGIIGFLIQMYILWSMSANDTQTNQKNQIQNKTQ